MTHIAILGLATADTVVTEAGIREQAGGAPIYTGAALAAAGHVVTPIFTIGDDAGGRSILAACAHGNLRVGAIRVQPGRSSPGCVLDYGADGQDLCRFDPGTTDDLAFSVAQRQALGEAGLIIVGAASPARIEEVLAAITPGQALAWIFKDDPLCFRDRVCASLIRRADYVFFNRAEAPIVDRWAGHARASAIFFQTLGADGVLVRDAAGPIHLRATVLAVADPTGAGDTFAGHALAGRLAGLSAADSGRSAIAQTAAFLAARVS